MKKTEDVINELSEDLSAIKPINTFKRFIYWLGFTALIATVASIAIGTRHDLLDKLSSELFLVEIILALATGLLAALSANWLSIPDAGQKKKWLLWLPVVPLSFLCMMVIYQLIMKPMHIMESNQNILCGTDIIVVALIPTVILFLLLKRAASTSSKLCSSMAMIAVLALGFLCSRLICPNDELGHLLISHYLPVLIVAVFGTYIGSKLLRW